MQWFDIGCMYVHLVCLYACFVWVYARPRHCRLRACNDAQRVTHKGTAFEALIFSETAGIFFIRYLRSTVQVGDGWGSEPVMKELGVVMTKERYTMYDGSCYSYL